MLRKYGHGPLLALCAMAASDNAEESWLFSKSELADTPSREDGVSVDEEKRLREEGARFIYDIGKKLRMPQLTVATACVFFHRFFMYRSFKEFSPYDIAASCLFLGGKVEETPKKIRDVVVCCADERTGAILDENSEVFAEHKARLLRYECVLLQVLSFDLTVDHPYKYILAFVKTLKGDRIVAQYAWNFVNDSMHATTLCLQYQPQVVACAMLQFAATIADRPFQGPSTGGDWWSHFFKIPATKADIEDIMSQLRQLYDDDTYKEMRRQARESLAAAGRNGDRSRPAGEKRAESRGPDENAANKRRREGNV